ncbi:MAG: immunoglobulin domain-containing protein, partial [Chitinivibrionales bacterium]
MKQLLRDLLVVALISGTMTCSKLPDDSLFQPVNFKPTITAPLPQITVVTEGRDTAVGVLVKGTAPFSYAWYKNNVPLNGFDSASLSL